ncbi:MFS transporter [Limnohabitans sp. T6-5]|uniref:MFS transporter n=1 Tax=Limnohabitans sp. T6-5 TaxID=1100724 RepID=UPI000D387FCA|nr:MFS transporter [Limnohabitans sp. T6-5]PUE05981.1 MFS transporter [Limnohabitans sp. T6-5]
MHFFRRSTALALGPFSFWLSLPQLISWGSVFYTFSLLMTPLEAELGMSRAESSLAFSLALLAEGLMAYLVGRWIDAGHERRVMTLGSVWIGAGLLAHSFVQSKAEFYAVWIWLGLGTAATFYTPAFAVVTRRFAHDFRRAIITLTFLGGLASTVFIPLFSWWMDLWGWRQALWALAALQWLVCAPLHAWLLQGAPPAQHLHATGQTRAVSVRVHLRQAPFWLLALFMVLMMAVTSALPAHMIALLQESGLTSTWVIAIPAAIGAVQVVGRLVLFVFERYWDVHAANRWIPMLIPLGLLALLLGQLHPAAAGVFVVLFGLGNGMNTIVKGTAMAQYVSRAHVGQLNGLLGLPIALARAAAPLMVGLLWSPENGYGVALWWLLSASLLGTAALWLAQARSLRTQR